MMIAPLLIKYQHKIVSLLLSSFAQQRTIKSSLQFSPHFSSNKHVILCGYGRVGQNIARFLDKANLPFIAFDLDPHRVRNAQLAGDNVHYADASDLEILKSAGIDKARALIIGFINTYAAINIIEQVRKHHKKIPIIVRSQDESDSNLFYEKGATEVIPEFLEASLMMASHILLMMNIPVKDVYRWIEESRHQRYDLLRMVFPGQESHLRDENETLREGLHVVVLGNDSYAVGKKIDELALEKLKFKITTIRRGKKRLIDPKPGAELKAGDIVVLYGEHAQVEHAETVLLIGKN